MDEEDQDVIEITEDEVRLELGGTKLTISGIISKRHAQILVALILAMLGYNWETISGMI
tara:strand:+ start:605 stop:781 length:177 start_codon:yes stop_codon:yes gene_type:complete